MELFFISLVILALVILAMALGVMIQGKRLKGSCGGLGKIMGEDCMFCDKDKKEQCTKRLQNNV